MRPQSLLCLLLITICLLHSSVVRAENGRAQRLRGGRSEDWSHSQDDDCQDHDDHGDHEQKDYYHDQDHDHDHDHHQDHDKDGDECDHGYDDDNDFGLYGGVYGGYGGGDATGNMTGNATVAPTRGPTSAPLTGPAQCLDTLFNSTESVSVPLNTSFILFVDTCQGNVQTEKGQSFQLV